MDRKSIIFFVVVGVSTTCMPERAAAQAEWTVAGAAWGVLSGILSYEGGQAWKRWNHIPNEEELQRKTVEELARCLGARFDEHRLGQAKSYFLNATRELGYYINNPIENKSSLNQARTQSGYALSEFSQMGPQALQLYCFSAILHMAILQEKLKTSQHVEDEKKNIEMHIAETKRFVEFANNSIINRYQWNPDTLVKPTEPTIPTPGTLVLDLPTPEKIREEKAREGVLAARLLLKAFKDPKGAFPVLRAEIERRERAGQINAGVTNGLPSTPPSNSPAMVGSLAISLGP